MSDYDYKEVLRSKAGNLRQLLAKYGDKLADPTERNGIQVLIDNAFEIINGRFDALDYTERNEGIMNYHNALDSAIRKLSQFQEKELEDEKGKE